MCIIYQILGRRDIIHNYRTHIILLCVRRGGGRRGRSTGVHAIGHRRVWPPFVAAAAAAEQAGRNTLATVATVHRRIAAFRNRSPCLLSATDYRVRSHLYLLWNIILSSVSIYKYYERHCYLCVCDSFWIKKKFNTFLFRVITISTGTIGVRLLYCYTYNIYIRSTLLSHQKFTATFRVDVLLNCECVLVFTYTFALHRVFKLFTGQG